MHVRPDAEPTNEEIYFTWYLEELQRRGHVERFVFQPQTFEITSKVQYPTLKRFKRKPPETEMHTLLHPHTYTPDFKVYWTPFALNYFLKLLDARADVYDNKLPFFADVEIENNTPVIVSYIDTKSAASVRVLHQDGLTKFPYKQQLMWMRYHIYINKVAVPTIFKTTFTPERFLLTNVKQEPRVVHFTPRSLDNYVLTKTPSYEGDTLTRIGIMV